MHRSIARQIPRYQFQFRSDRNDAAMGCCHRSTEHLRNTILTGVYLTPRARTHRPTWLSGRAKPYRRPPIPSIRETGPDGKLPEQFRSPELVRNSEKAEEARHECFTLGSAAGDRGVGRDGGRRHDGQYVRCTKSNSEVRERPEGRPTPPCGASIRMRFPTAAARISIASRAGLNGSHAIQPPRVRL